MLLKGDEGITCMGLVGRDGGMQGREGGGGGRGHNVWLARARQADPLLLWSQMERENAR